jgi:HEAT repeat protein
MTKTLPELVNDFYGRDPILGEEASQELLKNWKDDAVEALVPLGGYPDVGTKQVEVRLKQIASALGGRIAPHLARAIATAPWGSKQAAAACYSGLSRSDEAESPLIELLEKGGNFDVERNAVEALGRVGADGWSYELIKYAKYGIWRLDDSSGLHRLSLYPFEKLSSYLLQALARFAAKAADPNRARSMFRQLTEFIQLREERLPHFGAGDSHMLIAQLGPEFTERSVDAMIEQWGNSTDELLQRLCTELLRDIAPRRAAKFLLEKAMSPAASDSVRRGASIALGEIRVPQVAQRLADTLKDAATDRTHLDWAFSTLYAVPADWSGLSGYADELLGYDNEQAIQLRYSLAFKGDDRCLKELIEHLDHRTAHNRWMAALALARLLGPESRPYLDNRAEDAGDDMERCGMYAALIRAGDHEKSGALHEALCPSTTLPLLYSIWKLEILDAFRVAKTFDKRAFPLWRTASQVGARQLQYFDTLSPQPASASRPSAQAPQAKPPAKRTKVFISYSRKDAKWLDRLQVHLKPLERVGEITRWDDTLIKPGEKWREAIERALGEAKVAVLLISADFIASDFINKDELPPLLAAAESEGVLILPIVLSPSRFEETKSLSQFQSVNKPSQPLSMMPGARREAVFVKVSKAIEDAFASS